MKKPKPTTIRYKEVYDKIYGAPYSRNQSPSLCEVILSEVHKKGTRYNLIFFHHISEIPDNSTYIMKLLGEVPQFYCIGFNDKGFNTFGKYNKGFAVIVNKIFSSPQLLKH